jgi:pyruvate kinase
VYRQLALYWGTVPVRIDFSGDPDKTISSAEKFLRTKKLAAPGSRMVIISDVHMGRAMIDSIQLRVVK